MIALGYLVAVILLALGVGILASGWTTLYQASVLDQKYLLLFIQVTMAFVGAIGGAPTQKDKTAWFRANRTAVERVASNKFDMGAFEKDGFISITHWRRRG